MMRVVSYMVLLAGLAICGSAETSEGQMVDVGGHRLFILCTGPASEATVILENGAGAGHEGWKKVQEGIEEFCRVCSYDRAGVGRSDKPRKPQTPDTTVDDLHRLLELTSVKGPYVMVGASLGGIFARRFGARYPKEIAAMVLVDSSHEEQYSHYLAISPAIAERFATQDGRFDRNEQLRASGQLEPGKRLDWHLDIPLVVLEHKRLVGPPQTEADRLAADWHDLQLDLASRSRYGRLIETQSGHFMEGEQPEIIVDSVREVIRQARPLNALPR